MSTCLDELKAIHDRSRKLREEFLKNDGKIDANERRRLDALGDDWQKARDACLAKQQSKIDKTAADAGARLKVDPSQLKAYKENVKKMSAGAQVAAADVLNVLLTYPPPADAKAAKDLREKIRESFRLLGDGEKLAIGKELNKLGIYIPNLKEDSPGAEDASARIKKVNVSGQFVDEHGSVNDRVQVDYIKGLVLQAQKQGFKVVVQIKRGAISVADVKKLFSTETGIAEVDLPKYMEVLEADSADYIWSEDNKWISVDGTTVNASPDISFATHGKLRRFTTHKPTKVGDIQEGFHSAGQDATDKPDEARPGGMVPEGMLQGQVDFHEYGIPWSADPLDKPHLSADALAKATGKKPVKTRTYNEGGNMLVGTKPDGQPYAMIGRDGLLLSVFHLEEELANETDPAKKKAHEFSSDNVKARRDSMTFDPNELAATKERLEDIYANPPVLQPGPPAANPPDDHRRYALYKASFDKEKKQFDTEKAEFNKDKDEFTKRFLAKIDITKDVFAADTKVPRSDLIFLPQPDFHIDMHMRPVAPGQVMVNDFAEDIKLIDAALALATKGSWEEKQLLSMKANALRSQKAMEPVIKEIKAQLQAKGLEVIPAPGVMEAEMEPFVADPSAPAGSLNKEVATHLGLAAKKPYTRKELGQAYKARLAGVPNPPDFSHILDKAFTRHANFMNAIPGTKDGTNQQFYMTNATSIGPLQKAYETYLKGKGVENVEWIGNKGGGEFDRNASERSLQDSGGLDCRENH
jgi:hypothetical protein